LEALRKPQTTRYFLPGSRLLEVLLRRFEELKRRGEGIVEKELDRIAVRGGGVRLMSGQDIKNVFGNARLNGFCVNRPFIGMKPFIDAMKSSGIAEAGLVRFCLNPNELTPSGRGRGHSLQRRGSRRALLLRHRVRVDLHRLRGHVAMSARVTLFVFFRSVCCYLTESRLYKLSPLGCLQIPLRWVKS
jgi:hypothetical protein